MSDIYKQLQYLRGTLKDPIITAKNFLEYYDVDISPRRFKLRVKIPKVVRKAKKPYQNKIFRYFKWLF